MDSPLRQIRCAAGKKQSWIAQALGKSESYVCNLERQKGGEPGPRDVAAIVAVYGQAAGALRGPLDLQGALLKTLYASRQEWRAWGRANKAALVRAASC